MRTLFFAFILVMLTTTACRAPLTRLAIQDAELQLPNDPSQSLALNGQWMFLPNELAEPDAWNEKTWSARKASASIVTLPGQWNQWPDPKNPGKNLPAFGYGTFVLQIKGLHNWPQAALQFPPILTASRIYFKDDLADKASFLGGQGVVGTSEGNYIPFEQQQLLPISNKSAVGYLIVQVSNFQLRKGGITAPIVLGQDKQLLRSNKISYGLSQLLVGMMLAICVYNLFLFVNRPEDLSSLTLSFFSLLVVSRLISTENLLELWIGTPSWMLTEIRYKIEYCSMILAPVTLCVFFHMNFPKCAPVKTLKILFVAALIQTLPVLFLSSRVFTPFLLGFQLLLFLAGIYATLCVVRVIINRDSGWQYLLIGGLPFSFAIVIDILVSRNLLAMVYIVQYVMVWFTMTQSHILGKKFANAFRTARHLTEHLQQEVEKQIAAITEQSRNMKAILDNVPVGMFTLTRNDMTIDADYSQHLEKIFDTQDIAQRKVSDFLLRDTYLDANEIEQTEQILQASLNEDELNFTLNERGLCRELVKRIGPQEKILSLSWVPIIDELGIVCRMLVTVHDISEIRKLAQESQERMNHLNRIAEILSSGKEKMQHFLQSTRRLLAECSALSLPTISPDAIKVMFINLHTIKGNGRQLHLRQITDCAHQCEKILQEVRVKPELWQKATTDAYLADLNTMVGRYEMQLFDLQFQGQQEALTQIKRPILFPILQKKLRGHALSSHDTEQLCEFSAAILGIPLRQILENALSDVNTLARDLGKNEPQTTISCPDIILSPDSQDLLQNVLVHVVRNSMDHGVEDAQERQEAGKSAQGKIQVTAEIGTDGLRFYINDDGRGLDISRLRDLHRKRQGQMNLSPSLKQTAETIFEDGMTTASVVTEISGRGMGMPAIKRYIENAGGKVDLIMGELNNKGFCPFTITFTMPDSNLLWTGLPTATEHAAAS